MCKLWHPRIKFPLSQLWLCSFPSSNYGRQYGLVTAFITYSWVWTMSIVKLKSIAVFCHCPLVLWNNIHGFGLAFSLWMRKVGARGSFSELWVNLKHRDTSHKNVGVLNLNCDLILFSHSLRIWSFQWWGWRDKNNRKGENEFFYIHRNLQKCYTLTIYL